MNVHQGCRHAVYFAPRPDSDLWRIGSALLGYDAQSGDDVAPLTPAGWTQAHWHDLTHEPRRYGFHATLKAPFRLRDGVTEDALCAALHGLAARLPAFAQPLHVARLGHFVAVVPTGHAPRLGALADAAVDAFEPFRATLSPAEIARRQPERLTPRQRELLDQYGYPYVREEFRFHMTLTGRLDPDSADPVPALSGLLEPALSPGPVAIDQIALFRQDTPGSRFRIVERAQLAHA